MSAKVVRSNYWLIDLVTADDKEDLIAVVSTHPTTLADVADYLDKNMKITIKDIWTSDIEEIEFSGCEVLRI